MQCSSCAAEEKVSQYVGEIGGGGRLATLLLMLTCDSVCLSLISVFDLHLLSGFTGYLEIPSSV